MQSFNIEPPIDHNQIERMIQDAEIEINVVFHKTTIMSAKLWNGFVITVSTSCIDEKNFDIEVAKKICRKKIKQQLLELEGYKHASIIAGKKAEANIQERMNTELLESLKERACKDIDKLFKVRAIQTESPYIRHGDSL